MTPAQLQHAELAERSPGILPLLTSFLPYSLRLMLLAVLQDTFLVGEVSASDPQGITVLLTVRPSQGGVPPSNLLDVMASHMTDTGEPRMATRQVGLLGLP